MLKIGCHLSSSKGYLAMGKQAVEIGANTFQFLPETRAEVRPNRWIKRIWLPIGIMRLKMALCPSLRMRLIH